MEKLEAYFKPHATQQKYAARSSLIWTIRKCQVATSDHFKKLKFFETELDECSRSSYVPTEDEKFGTLIECIQPSYRIFVLTSLATQDYDSLRDKLNAMREAEPYEEPKSSQAEVLAANHKAKNFKKNKMNTQIPHDNTNGYKSNNLNKNKISSSSSRTNCGWCGGKVHKKAECPAKDKKCNNCGSTGRT
eukprot:GHVR01024518.1.p1 GENE.GHVR01024518.1~~GHVR01024518.1.p1  ORF type:complete len:190 (-),score=15.99 GHVR01024518.1:296-865(-)